MMKINNFQGNLTSISAETKSVNVILEFRLTPLDYKKRIKESAKSQPALCIAPLIGLSSLAKDVKEVHRQVEWGMYIAVECICHM